MLFPLGSSCTPLPITRLPDPTSTKIITFPPPIPPKLLPVRPNTHLVPVIPSPNRPNNRPQILQPPSPHTCTENPLILSSFSRKLSGRTRPSLAQPTGVHSAPAIPKIPAILQILVQSNARQSPAYAHQPRRKMKAVKPTVALLPYFCRLTHPPIFPKMPNRFLLSILCNGANRHRPTYFYFPKEKKTCVSNKTG